jgi:hypothetical protein
MARHQLVGALGMTEERDMPMAYPAFHVPDAPVLLQKFLLSQFRGNLL